MLLMPAPGMLTWDSSGERSHEMVPSMFRRWTHAAADLGVPELLGVS